MACARSQARPGASWASPVSHAAVRVEHALRQFLLERMLLHFRFVNRDAKSWPRVGADKASLGFDDEPLFDHVLPPRHVGMHGFADDIARLREAELETGGGAYRALRIVGRQ